jgi:hypothetical protein
MSDITVTYKGNTIATMDASGTKTLETQGKYCEGDIDIEYVKPSGGGIEAVDYTLAPGYYNQDGTIHAASANDEVYTDQIECEVGDTFLLMLRNASSVTLWNCVCYWNSDGTFNSRVQLYNSGNTAFDRVVTVPAGCNKIAFTYRTYGTVTSDIYKLELS